MQSHSPPESPPLPAAGRARGDRFWRVRLALLILVAGFSLVFLQRPRPVSPGTPDPAAGTRTATELRDATNEYARGQKLAHTICASCHLFPEPALLDRVTWGLIILPRMSPYLGLSKIDFDQQPGGERVKAARIFAESPVISPEEWRAICTYYLEAAPMVFLPPTDRPPPAGLKLFEVVTADYHQATPTTTLVHIDPAAHKLYVGDANSKSLNILNAQGDLESTFSVDSGPVGLLIRPEGLYVTAIGDVHPSDLTQGKLLLIPPAQSGVKRSTELLTQLHRPTDLVAVDLNGDGREDFLITQFGNTLGHFSWFENRGSGKYEEHILIDRPGAIKAYVRDFNHDGRPDIIVQMAQAREGIYILYNQGGGVFRETTVLEFPPSWGSSYFEMADFNGDGFPDLLVTNGDNGDLPTLPAPQKPYHGVRIYLNDGKNQFKEAWFQGMPGAYKAMARDFDNDGDLDIAAISFFPDYQHAPRESFIYFENQGGQGRFQFKPYSFPMSFSGRWLTMDVGDLDGDGRLDIVLGAFNLSLGSVPAQLLAAWERDGPSVLILKNVGTR